MTEYGSINKLLHAHSYSIEERTGEPRCPLCSSQHTHTSACKVVTMSTQLRDCEVGYASKTKLGRRSAIHKFKATCTRCMHTTTNCRTLKHTTNHKINQRLQAAGYERKKTRNKPDAVYKFPVCRKHHSYTNTMLEDYIQYMRYNSAIYTIRKLQVQNRIRCLSQHVGPRAAADTFMHSHCCWGDVSLIRRIIRRTLYARCFITDCYQTDRSHPKSQCIHFSPPGAAEG